MGDHIIPDIGPRLNILVLFLDNIIAFPAALKSIQLVGKAVKTC